MSSLRFMCGAGIYQLVKIKLWLLWRGKKMLEFNQSDCGGFDSPGPSLVGFIPVETVQVVITSAKWNYNPENSSARSLFQQGGKRSLQYFITFNVTFNVTFLLPSQVTDPSCF